MPPAILYCEPVEGPVEPINLKKDNPEVIEKRCRVVLDFTVEISEITQKMVLNEYSFAPGREAGCWRWAERQNRLLKALLKDEVALEKFLICFLMADVGGELSKDFILEYEIAEPDEILEPVYRRMGEDAAHFAEAKGQGALLDYIDLMWESFEVNWDKTELIEAYQIK